MANYIARVELHSASYDDYEELHDNMGQQGFARMIRGSDGKDYHLPTGTYVMRNTSVSRSDALDRAGNAAPANGQEILHHRRRLGERDVARSCLKLNLWRIARLTGGETRLWLNSGCPTEKTLNKTASCKSPARQPKLKKSQ